MIFKTSSIANLLTIVVFTNQDRWLANQFLLMSCFFFVNMIRIRALFFNWAYCNNYIRKKPSIYHEYISWLMIHLIKSRKSGIDIEIVYKRVKKAGTIMSIPLLEEMIWYFIFALFKLIQNTVNSVKALSSSFFQDDNLRHA